MIKNFCFITWKGLYPYEYMDSCDKFQGIHLPPKKAYLSKLNMKGIRDHGICDWKRAGSQEYHGEREPRFLWRYVLENRCFVVGRCISDLLKYVLRARSSTCLYIAWISIAGIIKTTSKYCEYEAKRKGCELCLNKYRLELLWDRHATKF